MVGRETQYIIRSMHMTTPRKAESTRPNGLIARARRTPGTLAFTAYAR
jgi:hypothetical protein